VAPKDPRNHNPEVRLAVLEAQMEDVNKKLGLLEQDLNGEKPASACSRIGVLEHDKVVSTTTIATSISAIKMAAAVVSAVVAIGSSAVVAEVRAMSSRIQIAPPPAGTKP
jgi:hypothetical protein